MNFLFSEWKWEKLTYQGFLSLCRKKNAHLCFIIKQYIFHHQRSLWQICFTLDVLYNCFEVIVYVSTLQLHIVCFNLKKKVYGKEAKIPRECWVLLAKITTFLMKNHTLISLFFVCFYILFEFLFRIKNICITLKKNRLNVELTSLRNQSNIRMISENLARRQSISM